MLNDIGDWLLRTPGDFHIYIESYGINVILPNPFGSIAEMIFGAGLITILIFKFLKVIFDAFPLV